MKGAPMHRALAASAAVALLAAVGVPSLVAPTAASAQTRPAPAGPSDTAAGRRVFDGQCAWCHGNEGDGGAGPSLRGTLRHATTHASIVDIINRGIPGTDMPGFRLTERETRQTASYVLSLSRSTSRPGPGNAQRGAALYQSHGCGSCHVVDGRGGVLGPELTAIGAQRGAAYLREAIVTPAAAHPRGYLVVRAVPNGGPPNMPIRGIRVNEDVFWIQIRDASGTVHSLEKSELARVDRELDATLMPSYAERLPAVELDDLVAYLATLRGAK
jgi:cytochrome c oxidase cbb3-type subunit III